MRFRLLNGWGLDWGGFGALRLLFRRSSLGDHSGKGGQQLGFRGLGVILTVPVRDVLDQTHPD